MQKTILVVEDEIKLSNSICRYLGAEGYRYYQATTGLDAVEKWDQVAPDLIVLDVMLPDLNGMAVCQQIRAKSDVPIILLTARVDEADRLEGFAKGADDYVCKPFSPRELMSRIRAILRRSGGAAKNDILSCDDVTLYLDECKVAVVDNDIMLTQVELQLLEMLMSSPTKVFSREELLTAVHGKYAECYERTIDSHIKNLRKKLSGVGNGGYIKTVYGVGYKFQ